MFLNSGEFSCRFETSSRRPTRSDENLQPIGPSARSITHPSSRNAAMLAHILEIQNGKYQGRRVRIVDADVVVGRDETAKIRIGSSDVSRLHCSLSALASGILVKDLGSSNGTFVNGRPIEEPTIMRPGDTLTVGPMTLKFIVAPDGKAVAKPAKSADENLTDDDIASWLTDDAIPVASGDTDVASPSDGSGSTIDTMIPEQAWADFSKKRKFKTVAEEAQDIIRRHLESQNEAGD